VASNGELTGEACNTEEEDDVDAEDWEVDAEMPHGQARHLHRTEEDIRQPLAGHEHHKKKSSLMSDG
jgi:hypothetical protein